MGMLLIQCNSLAQSAADFFARSLFNLESCIVSRIKDSIFCGRSKSGGKNGPPEGLLMRPPFLLTGLSGNKMGGTVNLTSF